MIEELIVCPTCGHKNPPEASYCQTDGTPLHEADSEDPLVGRMVGNYRLISRKGEGGFGVVYDAEHRELGTRFAVKILHPQFSANRQVAERFRREALAAGRLRHEHVVYIADFGLAKGIGYYYAMEFLEGRTLKEAIDNRELFSAERILHIARQVTSAMERVHTLKIIHRDLKPENIFLIQKDGVEDYVKLVDFGIAKILDDENSSALTRTGLSVGTPLYMSPEQARGNLRTLDHRTDVYSWGVILFELLTGRPPFFSDSPHDVVMLHIRSKPPALQKHAPHRSFGDGVEQFVHRLLAKKPRQRPDSMLNAYKELVDILSKPDAIVERDASPPPSVFSMAPPLEVSESNDDDGRIMTPISNPATREIIQADVESTQISSTSEQLFDNLSDSSDDLEAHHEHDNRYDSSKDLPDWRSAFQTQDPPQSSHDSHDDPHPTERHHAFSAEDYPEFAPKKETETTEEELPVVPAPQKIAPHLEPDWQDSLQLEPPSHSPSSFFWLAFIGTVCLVGFALFLWPSPPSTLPLLTSKAPKHNITPPRPRPLQKKTPSPRHRITPPTPPRITPPTPTRRPVALPSRPIKPALQVIKRSSPISRRTSVRSHALPTRFALTIRSRPSSQVTIGRKRFGRTPITIRRDSGSILNILLHRKGYRTVRRTWRARRNTKWRLRLRKLKKKAPLPRTRKENPDGDIFNNAKNPFKNAPNPFRQK